MQAEGRKGFPLTLFITALLTLAADQLSKGLIRIYLPRGESVSWDGILEIRQVRNPGSAFGLFPGQSWPIFILSAVVFFALLIVLWRWGRPGTRVFQAGLGLICGGAIGNIIDRIAFGEVVDFIDLEFWPVFNLADLAIVIGVGITLVIVAKESWKREKREA